MVQLRNIYNIEQGKMRVVGLCSGSGNTLWKALELQKELENTPEGSPFEIVGLFTDQPSAKAVESAEKYGIPWKSIDIREFYRKRGAALSDITLRKEYDRHVLEEIESFGGNFLMLAGYAWLITEVIISRYPVLGIHPGDLTEVRGNTRILAGTNGVKSAFQYHMPSIRASAFIASTEADGGPLLITSPPINVDYSLHADEELRFRYYLKLVNEQNRLVGARALYELASGNFSRDETGLIYYMGKAVPQGIKFENWDEYPPAYKLDRERFISPRTVAVIGASNKPGIGNSIVRNIFNMDFAGTAYAVNVRGEDVYQAKGYRSVLDIPGDVDTAVIALPSRFVLEVAEECGKKGVKSVVCVSAGFREMGEEGLSQEEKLIDIIRRYGMCMIGPNCMGMLNTADGVSINCTINPKRPRKGNLGMLTQSGALGASLLDYAEDLGIGFSIMVSTGNQAGMNMCDFLPYLEKDENTKVILMYMEQIQDPIRFRHILKKMTKPVVVLKSGRTAAGATAASSHTGSMVGNDEIADAILRQAGAIRADSLEDAFLLAATLSKVPTLRGRRVGIISNTGGLGILMTDSLVKYGFELPPLPDDLVETLRPQLLPEASVHNPLDLVAPAPPEHYRITLEAMLSRRLFDAVIIACIPPATVDTAQVAELLTPLIRDADIPVLSCFFGAAEGGAGARVLKKYRLPELQYPEKISDILHYMAREKNDYLSHIQPEYDLEAIHAASEKLSRSPKGQYCSMGDAEALLKAYGIPVAASGYVAASEDVEGIDLRFPVVAKIDHPDIIHKSDVGGVMLNIQNKKHLAEVVLQWQKKFPGLRGVFLQEQIRGTLELIVGSTSDPSLGHAIVAGVGGTLVELIRDISYAHVPVSEEDVNEMLQKLKCYKLLTGFRGGKSVDINHLMEVILRVNRLLVDNPQISEIDLNPLTCEADTGRFVALDFRIRL